jgi:hypothetical protein
MTRAFERRAQRMIGLANDRLGKSRSVIWCFGPEHMPAMIDLMIAQGSLGESDRPHCVHWSAIRGAGGPTQDEIARVLDADAMLEEAGIRTIPQQAWKAWRQGPDALEALWREWLGELTADDLKCLAELELRMKAWRLRECAGAASGDRAGASDGDGC